MKILCVDEDKQILEQLTHQFSSQGYALHGVHDTLGAIETLEKHLDFNLMICEYKLLQGTAEPIFWHLSVNNYSLSSIVYCNEPDCDVRAQIHYPDLITIIKKPNLDQLTECVHNFAKLIAQTTQPR